MTTLPKLDSERQALSDQLACKIKELIQLSSGWISFAEFMQQALYSPGLGYYVSGNQKFGERGDFITAPLLSPLFSYCIARQCQQILTELKLNHILELGAGDGSLVCDCLLYLQEHNALPECYFILEVSPELCDRQKLKLEQQCPDLVDRVKWLSKLPDKFSGVVIGNEVLDAMPVHLFELLDQEVFEKGISWQDGFVWQNKPAEEKLNQAVNALNISMIDPYQSEINLALTQWLADLSNSMEQAVVLLSDYGFTQKEYYHPQREEGTLMCHFRHHAHDDPLVYIGQQDITAHVDFTALAYGASEVGLEVAGFTTQANFLMGCGIDQLMLGESTTKEQYQQGQALKKLLLPTEMGELFKFIALTKNCEPELSGFSMADIRHKL